MKKDLRLLAEDMQRRENCYVAMDILAQRGIGEWEGFADDETRIIGVRGGGGQVHVGDVFRSVFPTLEYLRSRNMKVVLATSPGMQKLFEGWSDVLKIIDGSRPPEEIANEFHSAGVSKISKWSVLLTEWKGLLKGAFDQASQPVFATRFLDVPHDLTLQLREKYSSNDTK